MIVPVNEKNIARAAALLAAGQIVALPTETVYGLAADAMNGQAVAAIFAAKGRPQFNPLIAHVSGADMADKYVEIDALSRKLMRHFWPGPVSFVLPLRAGSLIHPLVTAGLPTMAVRCPQGIFADIIARLGRPLAAPSANISGRISPTTASAVERALGSKIPLILDGGACAIGVESTILAIKGGEISLLRAGGLTREAIEEAAGQAVIKQNLGAAIAAPGMLPSHYAPEAVLRLKAWIIRPGEALLAFGANRAKNYEKAVAILNLSEKGDVREAALHLFAYLARLDKIVSKTGGLIAVEPIPQSGLGEAVNDRLARAAAKRPPSGF
ncbi:MAG: threonylcarbamoyl-AMP synthase [Candidatus Tokpelaia sp.]|nr:MAG: threonylcarbamoyl-AMP synthase [Candidatus Tokpelaia sp.]KAA6206722.1 MAG: threonylcarbamoyl-AMP synthase [Candidatus Tokpelaia sp.]